MFSRHSRRPLLLSLAVCAALIGCHKPAEPPAVSLREQYEKIEGGMTCTEVEMLLGPGRPLMLSDGPALHIREISPDRCRVWQDSRTSITVAFNDDLAVAKLRAIAPAEAKR